MILVLAGTIDGRQITETLTKNNYKCIVSVFGDNAVSLINGQNVVSGGMNYNDMLDFFDENGITTVVDATHPFAAEVSKNAILACENANVNYIRFERDSISYNYSKITMFSSHKEVIDKLNKTNENIFLTIGTRFLDLYTKEINDITRLTARVLSDTKSVEKCVNLGLNPKQIIAVCGAFSADFNQQMFLEFSANVIVTKESGSAGGVSEKIQAAEMLDIPIYIVKRPKVEYPLIVDTLCGVLEVVSLKEIKNF